ncbi:hypothetical protein V6N11_057833 [Hibiscus sabdariffa]|uniref:Uncharacterized protein n=1 Tax=Hibiscus sabdariffa TaxID=183260 RepID=A0ABR2P3U2_9ROSI
MAGGPGSQNTEVVQAPGLEKSGPVPFLCWVGLTGSVRVTYRVTGSAPKGGKPFILHHLFDPTPTKVREGDLRESVGRLPQRHH